METNVIFFRSDEEGTKSQESVVDLSGLSITLFV